MQSEYILLMKMSSFYLPNSTYIFIPSPPPPFFGIVYLNIIFKCQSLNDFSSHWSATWHPAAFPIFFLLDNVRYRNVEPVINTGANLRTELERLEELHQLYKFRSDEVFRRVTIDNLVSLMVEVNKLEYQLRPSSSSVSSHHLNGLAVPEHELDKGTFFIYFC